MNVVTLALPGLDAIGWPRITHIDKLSIHHTAVAAPSPGREYDHVLAVHNYHVQQGWGGIGYHALYVPTNRTLYISNDDIYIQRAGVANRNRTTIHLCIAGDYSRAVPSETAIRDLQQAVQHLRQMADNPGLPVVAHRDWAVPEWPTSCPGDRYREWVPRLATVQEADELSAEDKAKIAELQIKVDRLERLLAGNGIDLPDQPGGPPELTGEAALEYLYSKGTSAYRAIHELQQEYNKLTRQLNDLYRTVPQKSAEEVVKIISERGRLKLVWIPEEV